MKQERIYKRYFQERKAFVLMVCLLILAAATVSGTIAYLIEESGSVNNDFTYGEVSCRVTEKFDGRVKENAAIREIQEIHLHIFVPGSMFRGKTARAEFTASRSARVPIQCSLIPQTGWKKMDSFIAGNRLVQENRLLF